MSCPLLTASMSAFCRLLGSDPVSVSPPVELRRGGGGGGGGGGGREGGREGGRRGREGEGGGEGGTGKEKVLLLTG